MHLEKKKIDRKGQEAAVRTSGEGPVRLLSSPVREYQSPCLEGVLQAASAALLRVRAMLRGAWSPIEQQP